MAGPKLEADSTVTMGAAPEAVGGVSWRLWLEEESLSTWDWGRLAPSEPNPHSRSPHIGPLPLLAEALLQQARVQDLALPVTGCVTSGK